MRPIRTASLLAAVALAVASCSDAPTRPIVGNNDIPADPTAAPPPPAPTVGSYVPSTLSVDVPSASNPTRVRLTVGGLTGGETYSSDNLSVVEDGIVKGIKVSRGNSARLKADIAILIDNTSSMESGIRSVRTSVLAFVKALRLSGQDINVGAVAFNDNFFNNRGTTYTIPATDSIGAASVYGYRPLTADLDTTGTVYTFVAGLPATGGGDSPELAFSAIDFTRRTFAWRPGAQRIYIVISDVTSWGRLAPSGASRGINPLFPWTDVTLGQQLLLDGSVVHTVTPDVRTTATGEYNIRPLSTVTGGTWTLYSAAGFDLTTLPILGVTTSSVLVEFVKGGAVSDVKSRTVRVVFNGAPNQRGERSVIATY